MRQILLSDTHVICLFQILVSHLHPFRICKGDVFVIVLPVDLVALGIHPVDKVLPAYCFFHRIHDSESGILDIGFYLAGLRLLQEVVSLLPVC